MYSVFLENVSEKFGSNGLIRTGFINCHQSHMIKNSYPLESNTNIGHRLGN